MLYELIRFVNFSFIQREKVPFDYALKEPDQRQIYRFIRTLFNSAQLTAECAIVTLVRYLLITLMLHINLIFLLSQVYLERLLSYAEICICPANWRRILLGR